MVLSFAGAIIIGTLLLMLPQATISGGNASAVDALFTATSATCVTGLIVKDTAGYFSIFGQLVILFLIQIGGLGIMTFSVFLALFYSISAFCNAGFSTFSDSLIRFNNDTLTNIIICSLIVFGGLGFAD